MDTTEINDYISLLNEEGRPKQSGWARFPFFLYNPAHIHASRRRVAEIDRFIVYSPTHIVTVEVQNAGYLGCAYVSVVSLKEKKPVAFHCETLFPQINMLMPMNSKDGKVRFHTRKAHIEIVPIQDAKLIKADIPLFDKRRSLRCCLVIYPLPKAQSFVSATTWRRESTVFRLSCTTPSLITEGVVQLGTTEIGFTRNNAWSIFNWVRAVRPRQDMRFWATASGAASDGTVIGFSIGYSSADTTFVTENAFFFGGVIHKLDQVTFQISPSAWLLPWRFTSSDKRLEMIFTPQQEHSNSRQYFFHAMRRRQLYGFFSGTVILDGGAVCEFHSITGFAERQITRL